MNSSLLKRITNIAVIALAAIGIVFAFAFIGGMKSGLDISFYLVYCKWNNIFNYSKLYFG